ncbi:MAG TPA: hypothetical protein VJ761_10955 [Ktedonobacteraceae bacterium]|nr:hypothetical protein [Ktedonobacteraceae bacterium]
MNLRRWRVLLSSLFTTFVVLVVGASIVPAPSTYAIGAHSIILPYGASGYHYLVVAHGDDPGFQKPGYNDSSFNQNGVAAFGYSADGCPLDSRIKTPWAPNTDLLVRITINLPPGTTGLKIHVAIDNNVIVYWNGDKFGSVKHEQCAQLNTLDKEVPNADITPGANLLALRAIDTGSSTFLDLEVTQK